MGGYNLSEKAAKQLSNDHKTLEKLSRDLTSNKSSRRGGPSGTSTQTAFPCKITGGVPGAWDVDIHADGKDLPKTDTGTLQVLQINLNDTLEVGTWVMGFTTSVIVETP